ncbi:hypothetical protein T439DRAFT_349858, partial [Meredithblackwellia eburnea MCA 4105]
MSNNQVSASSEEVASSSARDATAAVANQPSLPPANAPPSGLQGNLQMGQQPVDDDETKDYGYITAQNTGGMQYDHSGPETGREQMTTADTFRVGETEDGNITPGMGSTTGDRTQTQFTTPPNAGPSGQQIPHMEPKGKAPLRPARRHSFSAARSSDDEDAETRTPRFVDREGYKSLKNVTLTNDPRFIGSTTEVTDYNELRMQAEREIAENRFQDIQGATGPAFNLAQLELDHDELTRKINYEQAKKNSIEKAIRELRSSGVLPMPFHCPRDEHEQRPGEDTRLVDDTEEIPETREYQSSVPRHALSEIKRRETRLFTPGNQIRSTEPDPDDSDSSSEESDDDFGRGGKGRNVGLPPLKKLPTLPSGQEADSATQYRFAGKGLTKIPEPDKYGGSENPKTLRSWATSVHSYLLVGNVHPDSYLAANYIQGLLSGGAYTWFTKNIMMELNRTYPLGHAAETASPWPFDKIVRELTTRYCSSTAYKDAERKWRLLKQRTDGGDSMTINQLIIQIEDLAEDLAHDYPTSEADMKIKLVNSTLPWISGKLLERFPRIESPRYKWARVCRKARKYELTYNQLQASQFARRNDVDVTPYEAFTSGGAIMSMMRNEKRKSKAPATEPPAQKTDERQTTRRLQHGSNSKPSGPISSNNSSGRNDTTTPKTSEEKSEKTKSQKEKPKKVYTEEETRLYKERRANGECYKCGSKDHQISFHNTLTTLHTMRSKESASTSTDDSSSSSADDEAEPKRVAKRTPRGRIENPFSIFLTSKETDVETEEEESSDCESDSTQSVGPSADVARYVLHTDS